MQNPRAASNSLVPVPPVSSHLAVSCFLGVGLWVKDYAVRLRVMG